MLERWRHMQWSQLWGKKRNILQYVAMRGWHGVKSTVYWGWVRVESIATEPLKLVRGIMNGGQSKSDKYSSYKASMFRHKCPYMYSVQCQLSNGTNYRTVPIIERYQLSNGRIRKNFTRILTSFTWMCSKCTVLYFWSMHCALSKTVQARSWESCCCSIVIGKCMGSR